MFYWNKVGSDYNLHGFNPIFSMLVFNVRCYYGLVDRFRVKFTDFGDIVYKKLSVTTTTKIN